MKKKSGPTIKVLEESDIESFKSEGSVVVVGHFQSETTSEYKQFLAAANANDDVSFGAVLGASAPSITLYKNFDEKEVAYSGAIKKTAILDFIAGHRLPTLIPFNQETSKLLFAEDQPIRVQVLLMAKSDDKKSLDTFGGFAKQFKGKVLSVHVDETQDRVMSYFGVEKDQLPSTVLIHMPVGGAMKKYMPKTQDVAKVGAFIEEYFSGALKPFLKSDPVPASQDESVFVLVGTEFEKVALNDDKDVFVEFYAPVSHSIPVCSINSLVY